VFPISPSVLYGSRIGAFLSYLALPDLELFVVALFGTPKGKIATPKREKPRDPKKGKDRHPKQGDPKKTIQSQFGLFGLNRSHWVIPSKKLSKAF